MSGASLNQRQGGCPFSAMPGNIYRMGGTRKIYFLALGALIFPVEFKEFKR